MDTFTQGVARFMMMSAPYLAWAQIILSFLCSIGYLMAHSWVKGLYFFFGACIVMVVTIGAK